MNKIKIAKINIYEKDKEGSPYETKQGNSYKKLLVTTDKGTVISGMIFSSDDPRTAWREGQEVEWEVKGRDYEGKKYYDFSFFNPKETKGKYQLLEERIQALEKNVVVPKEEISFIEEEPINLEDIPL